MSSFQDMMQRARKDAADGDWQPRPGTHKAVVVEGDAFESRAGDTYAKTRLELRDPGDPDEGKHWDHLMSFATPQAQQMSVHQLSVYGLSDDDIDGLEDVYSLARHMAELVGTEVEVACKSRDEGNPGAGVWTNILSSQPQQVLDQVPVDREGLGGNGAGDPPATAPDDDPPPF